MKFNGKFALRLIAAAAICSATASAFAFGGSFEDSLFNVGSESQVVDDSFFAGQALTMGDMSFNPYKTSSVDNPYADCTDCGMETGVVYTSTVYVDPNGWQPVRTFTPVRSALRVSADVVRGVRNFLCDGYEYCKPAYVCDPCWNICCEDVCAPIDTTCCDVVGEPCAPACPPLNAVVYAPRTCCGYGYYPGQLNKLDPTTGKSIPQDGAKTQKVDVPDLDNAGDVNAAQNTKTPVEPQVLGGQEDSADDANDAALDSYQSTTPNYTPIPEETTDDLLDQAEEVPAVPATGAGLIRMLVPEDSVVYVNGYRTNQKGELRTFAAKNLEYGENYSFDVKVVAVRDGKTYVDSKNITLTAGDSTALAFNLTLASDETYALNK